MAQDKSKYFAYAIIAVIAIAFFAYYIAPMLNDRLQPPLQYSHTMKFKTNVAHLFNETYSSANFAAGVMYVYDMNWNLLESISYSSGFTSANYYASGTQLRYRMTATGIQTISGLLSMPFYDSEIAPASGYHIMSNLNILYNPTPVCTYSLNGAYNTSAATVYDVSTSGTTITVSIEFYNTKDESGLRNYSDNTYSYCPLVKVENYYYNATITPLNIHIAGLELVRAETATTSGIYIARPAENSLDRNKNQGNGQLTTNNRMIISFTIDAALITGSNYGSIRITLYDSVDYTYYKTYGAGNTGAETLLGGQTLYNIWIKP